MLYLRKFKNKLENPRKLLYNRVLAGSKGELIKTPDSLEGKFKMANSTTTKAVNYTAEQTAKMVSDYTAGVTTEQIALEMGKSVRSIVAKLSREKVYVAKTYTTKTGETVAKKDAVADAIGAVLMLTEAETESLTKANKTALAKIFAALAASKPL